MWYARSKKYGEKNVMYDSYAWYNHMLSDASQMKNMPEVRNKGRRPCTEGLLEAWGGGGAFCGDIEACQLLVGGTSLSPWGLVFADL